MKAVALFSGGLDSLLAIKIIEDQGIDVAGLRFKSSFFDNTEKIKQIAESNNVQVKIIDISEEYLKIVKKPKHGYGKNLNPCIDCKIFMLKKARDYAKKTNAKFVITGEVLGQRPMSQNLRSLKLIEAESGLKKELLRPLSAKLLDPTKAELNNWVVRTKLFDVQGRTRKVQFRLAKKYKVTNYTSPAGGCLLTEKTYSHKLKDLLENSKATLNDISLLKTGRHFRFGNSKIIVGRNEHENSLLEKERSNLIFDAKDVMGPITILQGRPTKKSIELAGQLTARYSDAKEKTVVVLYGKKSLRNEIKVTKINDQKIEKLRII
ncbi:MAG: tRNA 4-thiouridine(8) synthase ThiI [Nanoarchaeota archaeon]